MLTGLGLPQRDENLKLLPSAATLAFTRSGAIGDAAMEQSNAANLFS